MMRWSGLIVFGLSVTWGCQTPNPSEAPAAKPNVLILMVDALRADRLGVNGYPLPTTPHIDELASEGINFRRAFSHSTWTKPSIATLFTSVYPSQHGLDQVALAGHDGMGSEILAADLTTLAERFQAAGYRTAAVINQVHITARFGFDQGFEFFDEWRGMGGPRLNRKFLRWQKARDTPGRPFFAYIHYLDAHWPYTHRDWKRSPSFGSVTLSREPPDNGRQSIRDWAARLELPGDLEALETRYDHEVAYTDRAIGELVHGLKDLGLYEDTIIVVTADHGEAFLEHGELLHGHAPYEEMIRIPLVIRLPARLRGRVRSMAVPVGLIDLMPTLLDLAGLEQESGAQGRSFAPLIRGQDLRSRLVFVETESAVAVRGGDRKLIRFADGRQQHFDLGRDPLELRPLVETCGAPCTRLETRLADFSAAMASARQTLQTATVPLERQDIEDMRALGYLD